MPTCKASKDIDPKEQHERIATDGAVRLFLLQCVSVRQDETGFIWLIGDFVLLLQTNNKQTDDGTEIQQ